MEAARQPWPALGVLLMRDGLVSKDELETILAEERDDRLQRMSGRRLGEILIRRGVVTPTQVARLVAEQYELPFIELDTSDIDVQVAHLLTEEVARRFSALPVSVNADGIYLVVIADPATVLFSDELRRVIGSQLKFAVVGPSAFETAIASIHDRSPVLTPVADSPADDDWQGVVVPLHSEKPSDLDTAADETKADPETPTHFGPPLGALLVREGLITEEQLDEALTQQSQSTSWRLGEIVVDRGFVTASVVARLIAEQYELPFVELETRPVDPAVAVLLPREIARAFPAVPIATHYDGSLDVAIADPTNVYYSDELQDALGVPLTFVVASPDAIEALIDSSHTAVEAEELDAQEATVELETAAVAYPPQFELPKTRDGVDEVDEVDEDVVADTDELPEFVVDHLAAADTFGDVEWTEAGFELDALAPDEDVEETADETVAVPEVVAELAVPEDLDAAVELASADVPGVEDESVEWPSWTTELELTDDRFDQSDDVSSEASGPIDAVEEDLAAALLAEVTERHELAEHVPEFGHDTSFALVEIDSAEGAAEAAEPDQPTEPDTSFALLDVEPVEEVTETAELDYRTEPATSFALEIEPAAEVTEEAESDQPTEPDTSFALIDVDPSDDAAGPAEPVQHEALADETPAASANDLDAAIDEVLALGASAIHFSPQGEWHSVRVRIDGLVRELGFVAKEDMESLVDRVEASTAMRVDVIPTKQGDKVVLFPREQAGSPRALTDLGLTSEAAAAIRSALDTPSGAIVVCGPVGSGTTTTLYAALEAFATPDRVVASIEDPVERVIDGVDQIEVNAASGITLADGLRTLLATDSDAVLVGEIRDSETAVAALQAAVDGRHVLAGVRAPSSADAIRRLAAMNVDASVLAPALACVVAQRLVRRVCAECRETYYASAEELAELGQPAEEHGPRLLARGRGCNECDGTGFRGRVGIFEILTVTEEIRALVYDGSSVKKIHRTAISAGMQTLRDEGVRLCLEGVTTAGEIQRILGADR